MVELLFGSLAAAEEVIHKNIDVFESVFSMTEIRVRIGGGCQRCEELYSVVSVRH